MALRLSIPTRVTLAAALLSTGLAAAAAPTYQATGLALPSGMDGARVWGIQNGIIVGETYSNGDFMPHATAWTAPGSATLLNGNQLDSAAYAVSSGRVVGFQGAIDPTKSHAVQWNEAQAAITLVDPLASSGAQARAAAGSFTAGALGGGAFVWDGSGGPALVGNAGSIAYGVSSTGVAVGQDENFAAVVFNGAHAGMVLAASGAAWGILGDDVVGTYDTFDANGNFLQQRAFLATLSGDFTDLFAGTAFAMNAEGTIVGSDFENGVAMLYEDGVAYDLNALVGDIADLDGFTLTQARGIDADGSIVAFGMRGGEEMAFLLRLGTGGPIDPHDPGHDVPEPPSSMLAGAALLLLLLTQRGRHGVAMRPLPPIGG